MTLRIGGLRRAPEANVETIRYYERIGLLIAPARIEGSYCAYGEAELNRLCFIRRGRNLGFSIKQVRDLLACRIAGINHALMWTPWPMRGPWRSVFRKFRPS